MAYLAYYFHWPYLQIMGLNHLERRRWAREVARLNERINDVNGEIGNDL